MLFDFGQPTDGIFQVAFVVEDLETSIEQFSSRLDIGPWTTLRDVGPDGTTFLGKPSRARSHVAFGFCGHMAYELIQPTDNHPSVHREVIEDRGYGFHHFGRATSNFDRSLEAMSEAGYEPIGRVQLPGLRIAMLDTRDVLPGMTELIEASEAVNTSFTGMWMASLGGGGVPAPPPPAPPSGASA